MTRRRAKTDLAAGRRIVVKIGSALLVDQDRGTVHRKWLDSLGEDIAALRGRGREVLIVSSGAIAVGRRHLRYPDGHLRLDEQQAAAATGMIRLAHAYQEVMAHHDLTVAQVLVTIGDTENRRRYINARNTLGTLLRLGVLPLINENDSVATDEIRFGDNDRLAARVAAMTSADTLVLLSDVDGLYTADPRLHGDATLVPEVGEITADVEAMAGVAGPGFGSGGMVTKVAAARIATGAGCRTVIADGKPLHPLSRIDQGGPCTVFRPQGTPLTARKRWIAGSLMPAGTLTVDDGALKALRQGRSLLPAGVTAVEGAFERGDAVVVRDAAGREVARGLIAYPAGEASRIMGHKTREIEGLLGYRGRDEMIHRDDMVLV